jgi:hypothetical protein
LEAFKIAKNYIEKRGKPKSDVSKKRSKGPVKKQMNKNKLKNKRKQLKQEKVSDLKRLRLQQIRQMPQITQNSLFDGVRSSNNYETSNASLFNY